MIGSKFALTNKKTTTVQHNAIGKYIIATAWRTNTMKNGVQRRKYIITKKIRSTDFHTQNYSHHFPIHVDLMWKTMATTSTTTTIFHYRLPFRLMDRSFRLQMALVNESIYLSHTQTKLGLCVCSLCTLTFVYMLISVLNAVRPFPPLTHLILDARNSIICAVLLLCARKFTPFLLLL